jgi:anti-sigma factor RsiW
MNREELEFRISQYVDGTLSREERASVETILAGDVEARQMLAEFRRIDQHLAREMPLPNVKWEQLASHISAAVDEVTEAPAVIGRITPETATATSAWTWRSRLAIAASIVIVLGSALMFYDHGLNQRGSHGSGAVVLPNNPGQPGETVASASSLVVGPQVEPATGPAVQQITVGPSPALAAQGDSWRYAEGVVVTRPSTAVIAGEMKPESDGDSHIR